MWDKIQPFILGGTSGCIATVVIQPVDMIKVRIQLKSEKLGKSVGNEVSPLNIIKEIYAEGGISRFYRGLDSALARQICYATTRLGLYKTLYLREKTKNGGREPSLLNKCVCSALAGLSGALVANPADLALVRVQADTMLPASERRNYKNVSDAFKTIVKDEGFLSLWRGSTPTVTRAIVANLGMLAPYDEIKSRLSQFTGQVDTQPIRIFSSACAGFLVSFLSLPFDNAKTKIQKMNAINGVFPYKNIFDAMFKTARNEGLVGLWVGFPTYYFRIAPHVIITLIVQDYLTDIITSWKKGQQF